MAQQTTVEVWVLIDANGDHAAGHDQESCKEAYENNIGAVADAEGFRLVKLTLTVPLPAVVELSGTVPADGEAALTVA